MLTACQSLVLRATTLASKPRCKVDGWIHVINLKLTNVHVGSLLCEVERLNTPAWRGLASIGVFQPKNPSTICGASITVSDEAKVGEKSRSQTQLAVASEVNYSGAWSWCEGADPGARSGAKRQRKKRNQTISMSSRKMYDVVDDYCCQSGRRGGRASLTLGSAPLPKLKDPAPQHRKH
ncbi:uncharacterized protein IWZ02DRAFT_21392 [Phyllosticta citriasiana]|uniref:uncharacterized protein n=1 Tax=Phyllosticta citriasiana TaxID=595635 RepID=UPI0030FDF071